MSGAENGAKKKGRSTPHWYFGLVIAFLAVPLAASLLSGVPDKLPDVALGSGAVLHAERVFVSFLAFFVVAVVGERAWHGQLPSKISREGLEYESAAEALDDAKAAADKSGSGDSEKGEQEEDTPDDLLELRFRLEAKLAYIAKTLLRHGDSPTFLTIGSLRHDKLIPDDAARTADRVLNWPEDLQNIEPSQRKPFLKIADQAVSNFRAVVHFNLTRKLFDDNKWEIVEEEIKRSAQPDLIVKNDNTTLRVIPRFALRPNSKIFTVPLKRAEKMKGSDVRPIIVVPDRFSGSLPPEATRFSDLIAELRLSEDPRRMPPERGVGD